jgi:hypothetical protein
MAHEIIFDKDHSAYATKNREFNVAYIWQVQNHMNERLRYKGYVYLNTIYEDLGIEWCPLWENTCYIYDDEDPRLLTFDINVFEVDKPLSITILH